MQRLLISLGSSSCCDSASELSFLSAERVTINEKFACNSPPKIQISFISTKHHLHALKCQRYQKLMNISLGTHIKHQKLIFRLTPMTTSIPIIKHHQISNISRHHVRSILLPTPTHFPSPPPTHQLQQPLCRIPLIRTPRPLPFQPLQFQFLSFGPLRPSPHRPHPRISAINSTRNIAILGFFFAIRVLSPWFLFFLLILLFLCIRVGVVFLVYTACGGGLVLCSLDSLDTMRTAELCW